MKKNFSPLPISIVVPTYAREQALLETIKSLRALEKKAAEIIVVDQSKSHQPYVESQLRSWQQDNTIKLVTLCEPSIPRAMNTGLLKASQSVILFLDDDIKAHDHLLQAHYSAHQQSGTLIVAGRIIQPWDDNQKLSDSGHQFNSTEKKYISHFMGGNFSINKNLAIEIGGFDENFIGVAYRFESEFARRWLNAGYSIVFEPAAAIDHLKVASGGTREFGEHLTTARPFHAVGAYYNLMTLANSEKKCTAMLKRLVLSVRTRHHLKHPWYIPLTLLAEIRGLLMARRLSKAGPRYINSNQGSVTNNNANDSHLSPTPKRRE